MNLDKIENELKNITSSLNKETFIYNFLLAYGLPKSSINRLKKGDYNQSKIEGEVIWAKKIYFKPILNDEDVHDVIDEISKSDLIEKQKIRFIIVTDFKTFLSKDIKTDDTVDIEISKLNESLNFFLPLIGREKIVLDKENPADIKAANKMSKLFDVLIRDNETFYKDKKKRLELNTFFTKVLFCYFAEDSDIFEKRQFTNTIISYSDENGDNLNALIDKIFQILNSEKRINVPSYLIKFPYVNGSLFEKNYDIPNFSKESRKLLIQLGDLDWSSINPDILGSMMQSVVNQKLRDELGMHYTSVKNILKLIKPLFLDDLYDEFSLNKKNSLKLKKLLKKIYNFKVFDPACGSGNFLIISYKELCKLELEIYKQLKILDKNDWLIAKSAINLSQFYGIEIDNYAHELAKVSLYIAEHQINLLFKEIFGETKPSLPLKTIDNIFNDNALRIDWNKLCKRENNSNIYVIGNPPYLGYKGRNQDQNEDLENIFQGMGQVKRIDYIGCWFKLATDYSFNFSNIKFAFVSTNSITQGEQVNFLWPYILNKNLEIFFAHQTFNWTNNAKGKAGVSCVIIGLRNVENKQKTLFNEQNTIKVSNINPYLLEGKNIILKPRKKSISNFPEMHTGSSPIDGGNLILDNNEANELFQKYKNASDFIKPYIGGNDFLIGAKRFCIWIDDKQLEEALEIKEINKRIEKCKIWRKKSGRDAQKFATSAHKFVYKKYQEGDCLILPMTTSERRVYLPVGYQKSGTIISNGVFTIYNPEIYMFGVLSSKMHLIWMKTFSGRMRNDIRYSVNLIYNTFPFPKIDNSKKKNINDLVFEIIDEREKYSNLSMQDLYDPEKMPKKLLDFHESLDNEIDKIYNLNGFQNDNKRIEHLLNIYQKEYLI